MQTEYFPNGEINEGKFSKSHHSLIEFDLLNNKMRPSRTSLCDWRKAARRHLADMVRILLYEYYAGSQIIGYML